MKNNCKECGYYKKIKQSLIPVCSHGEIIMDIFRKSIVGTDNDSVHVNLLKESLLFNQLGDIIKSNNYEYEHCPLTT